MTGPAAQRHRHRLHGRAEPHAERLPAPRRGQQGERHPLPAKEELFTLGHLYETMLREMRDAAGENGEFYTPRPLVRFMVAVTDPKLGETVLDPACGTGGFLAEAYQHLETQCQTVEDRRTSKRTASTAARPSRCLTCSAR